MPASVCLLDASLRLSVFAVMHAPTLWGHMFVTSPNNSRDAFVEMQLFSENGGGIGGAAKSAADILLYDTYRLFLVCQISGEPQVIATATPQLDPNKFTDSCRDIYVGMMRQITQNMAVCIYSVHACDSGLATLIPYCWPFGLISAGRRLCDEEGKRQCGQDAACISAQLQGSARVENRPRPRQVCTLSC